MISSLHAQKSDTTVQERVERGYFEFRGLFEHELGEHISESLMDSITADTSLFDVSFPALLPPWLLEIPKSDDDSLYMLGISEPGMDSLPGYEMATRRALVMLALTGGPDVANIRDYYSAISDNRIAGVYIEFTRFMADVNACISCVDVIRTHLTRYDETIVLARMSKTDLNLDDNTEIGLQLHASLYSHLRSSGRSIDMNEKLDMETFFYMDGCEPYGINYQYTDINRIVNTKTMINDELVSDLPALGLRYTTGRYNRARPVVYSESGHGEYYSGSSKPGISLRNGLWHALVTGILGSLSDAAHEGSIHFRQVGDLYNNMPVSLSREAVNVKVALPMPSLLVKNNFLYLVFPDNKDNQPYGID